MRSNILYYIVFIALMTLIMFIKSEGYVTAIMFLRKSVNLIIDATIVENLEYVSAFSIGDTSAREIVEVYAILREIVLSSNVGMAFWINKEVAVFFRFAEIASVDQKLSVNVEK